MKRILLTLSLLVLLFPAAEARRTIALDRGWQFSAGDLRQRAPVTLPHTWSGDATDLARGATNSSGHYIRDLAVPADWAGQRVYLRFYGVSGAADLLVNGLWAGEHLGGYTAFTIEITPLLRPGQTNNLWLRVDNAPRLDSPPVDSPLASYGGVTRRVELIVTGPTHLSLAEAGSDGVYLKQTRVTPQQARVDATVRVDGPAADAGSVTVEVYDPRRDSVLTARTARVRGGAAEVPLDIASPHLWQGLRDPFLYDFRITLKEGARTLDSLVVPMGLRSVAVDPVRGFLLNGEPYPLRGATRLEDRMGAGGALTAAQQEQDVALLVEMGANAVRAKGYPHSPDFYALCDRAGILVWSEIPLAGPGGGYLHKPAFEANGRRQLTEMILQNYNHTSVALWGLFSNLPTRGTDSPVDYLGELDALAHTLDPTRPTAASSDQDGPINFTTDLIGWSQYLGWNSGQPADVALWLDQLAAGWSELRSGVGEYGAGGALTRQSDIPTRPDPLSADHPERWQTYYHEQVYPLLAARPALWGTFVHALCDYGTSDAAGSDLPGVSDFGLVSYDRSERKDAFYFYKANWNTADPFVHLVEKRWDVRPRARQTIRAYSNRPELELFVNGVSMGVKTGEHGVFRWDDLTLREGANTVEARSPEASDRTRITICPDPI